jgi:hydrogenase maturation protease
MPSQPECSERRGSSSPKSRASSGVDPCRAARVTVGINPAARSIWPANRFSACIVAVGSPHGDDQIAWRVVERLRPKSVPGIQVVAVSDPLAVLDYVERCSTLILVDACRSGARAGTIHRFFWPDPRLQEQHYFSTHGFGVVKALELAAALGRLPAHVVLFGVEVQTCRPAAPMSFPVRRALPKLYRHVLAEIVSPTRQQGTGRHRSSIKKEKDRQAHE